MRWSWARPADLLVPALALVAEGAWLAVAYVAIEAAFGAAPPLLGTLELTAAAALAAWLTRSRRLHADENPLRFLAWCLAVGAAGWLWSHEARAALLAADWVGAIGEHPGGWLALVAFMRGVGRAEVDDRSLTRFVLGGLPALAVPWLIGQLATGALRLIFVDAAFVATLTFMAAGFAAAGLARLASIGRETGLNWRRDRSWLALLIGVVIVVVGVGVPAASLLGLPVDAVFRGLLGPLLRLIGYALLVVAVPAAIASYLLASALRALGLRLPPPEPPSPDELRPLIDTYTFEEVQGGLVAVAIFLAVVLLLAFIVGRTWLRRRRPTGRQPIGEERSIRLPESLIGLPRLRIARPAGARLRVTDAETAYLAALEALAPHAGLARGEAETPLAHARRVAHGARPFAVELRRLATAFALARYAARRLPRREHRRSLERLSRLRSALSGRGRR